MPAGVRQNERRRGGDPAGSVSGSGGGVDRGYLSLLSIALRRSSFLLSNVALSGC